MHLHTHTAPVLVTDLNRKSKSRRKKRTVLDELHAAALADSGVRLLGLDADLLHHDALGVGRATERVALPDGTWGVFCLDT